MLKINYFFIYDLNGVVVSHVKEKLIGKNLYNFQDKQGLYLIQEMINVAKSDKKEGFVDYFWPSKSDETVNVLKLGYAKRIEGANLFIGSGVYIDEVETFVSQYTNETLGIFTVGCLLMFLISFLFLKSKVINPINKISTELLKSVEVLNEDSANMSSTSESLTISTTDLSSSLDQTAAAILEINSMINKTVESSKESEKSSQASAEIIKKGNLIVEKMIESMNNIANTNTDVTEKMQNSAQKVQDILNLMRNIEEKTSVINDIVFQTKLLSFNASVEAARAGDQGKGFAVVAEEVGNLAVMSGKSANEITDILSQSMNQVSTNIIQTQNDIREIIDLTKSSLEEGIIVADQNKENLKEVASNVDHIIRQISEITLASNEQARGVNEINEAVQNLESISKSNLASSHKAESISKNVNKQTSVINDNLYELERIIYGKKSA